jgi:hypothetical protein
MVGPVRGVEGTTVQMADDNWWLGLVVTGEAHGFTRFSGGRGRGEGRL